MKKDTLPLAALALTAICCVAFANITQNPDGAARAWVDNVAAPAMRNAIKSIPFSGLLAWPDSIVEQ